MAGKVIAVANMKGGVGKTTVVVGLAEALAAGGNEVLVIDLDAQANASICLAGDKVLTAQIVSGQTIEAFLADYLIEGRKIKFDDCIRECVSDVTHRGNQLAISLLASSPELRMFEQVLTYKLTKQRHSIEEIVSRVWTLMKEQLGKTKRSFDYVIIDCPPGISMLTDVSIRLADMVLVPTIPDFLSTYGLQAFCRSIWKGPLAERSLFKKPKGPPHVLITRERAVNEHRTTVAQMENERSAEEPSFLCFSIPTFPR
jgi:cellulose biosynthesis protein BcsQ